MTKRQRVIRAITHHETDIIPHHVDFTSQARENVANYLDDQDFIKTIDNHMSMAYYDGYSTEFAPEFFKDDFGVIWNRTGVDKDIGTIEDVLISQPDMSTYAFPMIPEARIRRDCQALFDKNDDTFRIGAIGFSLFERAWTLVSMEELLMYMITDPDFVHELFASITEYNLRVLDIFLEFDFDCIHFGDDWGQQKGLIMGRAHWQEYIKPYLKQMYDKVIGAGKYVSQHSCGDIHEIFPDLIEIGLNIYQTFQPEIYDIQEVKNTFGDSLSFWGGISTQNMLPFATVDEVIAKTKEIMKIMSVKGGYIAAPTHAIPGDVPPENIMAMIGVFQTQEQSLRGEAT